MGDVESHRVTELLVAWSKGDERALEALTPLVYGELRRLARSHMRRERTGHSLQSTALVHEAFLRLIGQRVQWNSRAHFLGIAAQMMLRILVDHAKAQSAVDLLALDEALERLTKVDPQRSRIVELRFFGGLSNEESGEVLGVSPATIQRQWAGARAWLFHELNTAEAG